MIVWLRKLFISSAAAALWLVVGVIALLVLAAVVFFGAATGWLQIVLVALTCIGAYNLLKLEGKPYLSSRFAMALSSSIAVDILVHSVAPRALSFMRDGESLRVTLALVVVIGFGVWRVYSYERFDPKELLARHQSPIDYVLTPSILSGLLFYTVVAQLLSHYFPWLSTFLIYPFDHFET